MRSPASMQTPVIAAVNGHCYAAGLILAISCDIRIASRNATFASPGSRLGMLPEGGQIARLPRLMSVSRALELMMTAEPMTADEAAMSGLVSRVGPNGRALAAAKSMGEAIARNSPAVVTAIKQGVLLGERKGWEEAEQFEVSIARELEKQPDAKEGVLAFLEKRRPSF